MITYSDALDLFLVLYHNKCISFLKMSQDSALFFFFCFSMNVTKFDCCTCYDFWKSELRTEGWWWGAYPTMWCSHTEKREAKGQNLVQTLLGQNKAQLTIWNFLSREHAKSYLPCSAQIMGKLGTLMKGCSKHRHFPFLITCLYKHTGNVITLNFPSQVKTVP